jgi:3-ketosteroid 9alpha-monooxygenase subunit A
MGRFPFPAYPNSWYAVAWSSEVAVGQARPVRYFGRDLVVFRGEDGVAHVLDAYCPHLGAHLGVNSQVVGNTIQCPFHAWRFDGTGACTHVPYSPKVPPKARIRSWSVKEINGAIMVWYHDRGDAPSFEVPHVAGVGAKEWRHLGFRTIHVRSHIQEMNENVYDVAHFVYIHHFAELPPSEVEEDGPFATVTLRGSARYAGKAFPADTINLMYGAGVLVIHLISVVEFKVIVLKTPVDEDVVEHRYAIVMKRKNLFVDLLLKPIVVYQVTADIKTDRHVWERKVHLAKPMLVKMDGPIMRFRKWHQQFYSPTTIPLGLPPAAPEPVTAEEAASEAIAASA